MNVYLPRIADGQLASALVRAGAVLIEGPRACGKTATALNRASSAIHFDQTPQVREWLGIDPGLVLDGDTPRLLDEWQLAPEVWNVVRGTVDARGARGQFILTGSTAPGADQTRHTGAGRFARLRMRGMTLFESGHSTGDVSFERLVTGDSCAAPDPGLSFTELTQRLVIGGWPGQINDDERNASENLRDYLQTVSMLDLTTVDGVTRDPMRVMRLMAALARSTSTEVTISTLARDETTLSRDSVRDYISALSRIFVVEDQPAWAVGLRSHATLRKEPKRHFVDPSLAAAALRADAQALRANPSFTGQLFESLVVQHLRVFSDPLRGEVRHARDSSGQEVDAVVQFSSGEWAGFEIKLSTAPDIIDAAAAGLLAFAGNVAGRPASALAVVTPTGPSYKRKDGVCVVALSALAP